MENSVTIELGEGRAMMFKLCHQPCPDRKPAPAASSSADHPSGGDGTSTAGEKDGGRETITSESVALVAGESAVRDPVELTATPGAPNSAVPSELAIVP